LFPETRIVAALVTSLAVPSALIEMVGVPDNASFAVILM